MITYPNITIDDWCKKHDFTVETVTCVGCNNPFQLSVPIKWGEFVGLQIPQHGCSKEYLYTQIISSGKYDKILNK